MTRPSPTTPIFHRDKVIGQPNLVASSFPFDPVDLAPFTIPDNNLGFLSLAAPRVIAAYGAYHVVLTAGGNPTPNSRVYVIDFLTDRTKPRQIGLLDVNPAPAHSGQGMFPTGLLIKNDIAYIPNEAWGGLWTVSLSNPAAPANYIAPGNPQGTSSGTLPFIGLSTMTRAAWHADQRYVVFTDRLNQFVRILDTQTGVNVASISTGSAASGSVTALGVWNGYAAAKVVGSTGGGFATNQLRIYDIDPPGSMSLVATLQGTGTEFPPSLGMGDIIYDLDLLYVSSGVGNTDFGVPTQNGMHLSVIDVSNPSSPQFVSRRIFPSATTSLNQGQMVKLGNVLYCSDSNQHSYRIDVSDPSNPSCIDNFFQPFTTNSSINQHMIWESSIGYFIHCDEAFSRTWYLTQNDFLVGH